MTVEKSEIQNRNGDWYLMTVRPYKTGEKKIDGVVFAFVDISDIKQVLESNLEARKLNESLNDINLQINSVREMEDILATVMEMGSRAIGAESALVSERQKKGWRMRLSMGFPEELAGRELSDRDNRIATEAADSRRPVVFEDAAAGKRSRSALVDTYGIKSVLAIPLMVRGEEIFGTVEFYFLSKPVIFSQEKIDFASKLAASVSLALDNAQRIKGCGSD